jgi:hypothetical protein
LLILSRHLLISPITDTSFKEELSSPDTNTLRRCRAATLERQSPLPSFLLFPPASHTMTHLETLCNLFVHQSRGVYPKPNAHLPRISLCSRVLRRHPPHSPGSHSYPLGLLSKRQSSSLLLTLPLLASIKAYPSAPVPFSTLPALFPASSDWRARRGFEACTRGSCPSC